MTQPVCSAPAVGPTTPIATPTGPSPSPETNSLLPSPDASVGPEAGLAAIYFMMSKQRDTQLASRRADFASKQIDRRVADAERKHATQEAIDAANDKSFFQSISDNIGIAGVVGLATFNYALVAADIALHESGVIDNLEIDVVDVGAAGAAACGRWDVLIADVLVRKLELGPEEARELLEKVGIPKDAPGISDEDVKPVAEDLLRINLMVAGAAASVLSAGSMTALVVAMIGLAITYGGKLVAETELLDPMLGEGASKKVGLGMECAGIITSACAGFAGSGAGVLGSAATKAAKAASYTINGGNAALNGADGVRQAFTQRKIDDAQITAEKARAALSRLEKLCEFIIDGMKETQQSYQRAQNSIQSAINAISETQLSLSSAIKA